ncbi:MAG TPA: hypothetical protein VJX72_04705 [Candidatus Acidoferrum sp.]|nr:hypothetical protein [Candidatus Acidoferrum sp.]
MQWNSHFAPARFLLIVILCLTTLHIAAIPKPLPDAVVRAHTIFLVNETSFNELQYSTIFELNKWGRFDLAESPEKADLIMRLDSGSHVRPVPEGQFPSGGGVNAVDEGEIPKGCTRISLLDPKTNAVLWSDTHKTDGGKVKNGHLLDGLREAFDAYEKSRR